MRPGYNGCRRASGWPAARRPHHRQSGSDGLHRWRAPRIASKSAQYRAKTCRLIACQRLPRGRRSRQAGQRLSDSISRPQPRQGRFTANPPAGLAAAGSRADRPPCTTRQRRRSCQPGSPCRSPSTAPMAGNRRCNVGVQLRAIAVHDPALDDRRRAAASGCGSVTETPGRHLDRSMPLYHAKLEQSPRLLQARRATRVPRVPASPLSPRQSSLWPGHTHGGG